MAGSPAPLSNRALSFGVIAVWTLIIILGIPLAKLGADRLAPPPAAQPSPSRTPAPPEPDRTPTPTAVRAPTHTPPPPVPTSTLPFTLAQHDLTTPHYPPTATRSPYEPTFTPFVPLNPAPTVAFTVAPPSIVGRPTTIGHSALGEPIIAYQFGSGARVYMLVHGIHGGNEWNTIALADELIEYLRERPETIPPDVTLYIVRALNPDGYNRARDFDGRVNENGVDLNRNFPVNWASHWERNMCWHFRPTTAGDTPGSEPETQMLIRFALQVQPVALISYHSAALGIFPAGVPGDLVAYDPASVRLAETLAEVSAYPYPPIDIGCVYTGTLPDWAAANGIAAVDLELTNHEETDFIVNLRILAALLGWE